MTLILRPIYLKYYLFIVKHGNHLTITLIFYRNEKYDRSYRLAVRTLASHAGNTGSIPVGTTNYISKLQDHI